MSIANTMIILSSIPWFALLLFLGWASIVDARLKKLPLEPLWGFLAFALLWSVLFGDPKEAMYGALFWFAWTGGLWFLSSGRWIGMADIWLTAGTGAVLGVSKSIEAWYFSYVVIGLAIAVLALLHKELVQKRIAFAPILFGGVLLAFLSRGRLLAIIAEVVFG